MPFLAVLIVVLVINYAPATTQGTSTVAISALSAPSIVAHVYVRVSSISLHHAGFLNNTGWTSISQTFPIIDLLASARQSIAPTVSTATIHSGRYDLATIYFANSTLVINGTKTPVSAPPPLSLNMLLEIYPNATNDLFILVSFDYAAFFATTPSLYLVLVSARASSGTILG